MIRRRSKTRPSTGHGTAGGRKVRVSGGRKIAATGGTAARAASSRAKGRKPRASGGPRRAPVVRAGDLLALAKQVVRIEAKAVAGLESRLGPTFLDAVETLARCRGKVIVSGVGKSGLFAHKLAATLTSTGTPAVFLHPADALHGDAGLFARGDVALFISKSGQSEELLALLPYLERHGIPLVSIVATEGTAVGRKSRVALVTGPLREACPMDLTPTTSLTLAQVMGDCLAVALLERRGFKPEDFRFLHPGGVIGRAASRRVSELMHEGDDLPRVGESTTLRDLMLEIMAKRLGITTVVDGAGRLIGVVSDGDFKRILIQRPDPWALRAQDVMTRRPATIERDALVATAVRLMEEREAGPITALVVVDDDGQPLGVLHLHDCLKLGGSGLA